LVGTIVYATKYERQIVLRLIYLFKDIKYNNKCF